MENSIRSRVVNLQIGESLTIQADEIRPATLRGYACDLGFALERVFTTHIDRKNRQYTISRVA